jgi:hypothetical protein
MVQMDEDLNKILEYAWKINPSTSIDYLNLKSKLLIIQELRNINISLKDL